MLYIIRMKVKNKHHNAKVAKSRGENWKEKLMTGRHESQFNPTKLKLARLKKKMSLNVMADDLDTSVNTLGSIERGKRLATKERAEKIAQTLGRSVGYFFNKEGKKFVAKHQATA